MPSAALKTKKKAASGKPQAAPRKGGAGRKFESSHGYFTADGREYVITRPDTPRPWVNVISNGDYGMIESQTGSGFSWRENSNLSRITRWDQDLIKDEWGKYIYLRDRATGAVWSATWKPCRPQLESFEVRHGQGYSVLSLASNGIRSRKTVFVDAKDPLEVWLLELKNESRQKRDLSVFTYFEWTLGNAGDTHREFQKTFIETAIDRKLSAIFGRKRPPLVPGFISTGLSEKPLEAFHALTNQKASGFDADKESFLGMYGSGALPASVQAGKLAGRDGKWVDPVAALQADVTLKPGEEKTLIFVLGAARERKDSERLIRKYATREAVASGLAEVKTRWDRIVDGCVVDTPDEALNFMTNIWLKYQTISGRLWARAAYYQQSGGIGFRDQLQDSHVYLPLDPSLTRKQILLHAEQQFSDGTVYHWWHPGTNMGAITHCSDDLLWLPFVMLNYLDETGDDSILDERVDYLPDPETQNLIDGELYEHCVRAIDRVLARFSPRGLPLIGECDWNDGLSHVGTQWKGESIWLGHFLYGILNRFAPLCAAEGDLARKKEYLERAKALKEAINKHAWDGEWYLGATRDDGRPLGSKKNDEGKIFLNCQTWAVITGTASPERAKIAMASAEKHLFREYGPLLLTPGYSKTDPTIGYITRYAPSVRENGGVYTHGATWAIQAECMMKNGERAYDAYRRMSPPLRGLNPSLYYAEPYVTAGNIDGPDGPLFGRGGWSWYTGSAAWMFRVGLDWILGVRATAEGLVVDPQIPKDWDRFHVRRTFRGATYEIEVRNPARVSGGVREIRLDGKKLAKPVLPILGDGKTHRVEVVLG